MDHTLKRNGFVVKHSEPHNGMFIYEKDNVEVIENKNIDDVTFYTANIKYTTEGSQKRYTLQHVRDILHLNKTLDGFRSENTMQTFIPNLRGISLYEHLTLTISDILNSTSKEQPEKIRDLTRLMSLEIDCIATQYAKFIQEKGLELGTYPADLNNFYEQYYDYGI